MSVSFCRCLLLGPQRFQRTLVPTVAWATLNSTCVSGFRIWEDDSVPFFEDVEDALTFLAQTNKKDLEILIKVGAIIDASSVPTVAKGSVGR
jgi:hypothetical protein